MIPTAMNFFLKKCKELKSDEEDMPEWMIDSAIEFAKLHVEAIKSLQKVKYNCGETGYIKEEEWKEIIKNIK